MKKIILSVILLLLIVTSFCQTTNTKLSKDYYLQKSKSQKTAAWILLAGGAGLVTVGFITGTSSDSFADNKLTTGAILVATGGAAMLGSIPFFIASGKNKRKAIAASAFFKMETAPVFSSYSVAYVSYPSICIKVISLKDNPQKK